MRRLTVSFATLALTSAALAAAAPTFDPKHLSEDDKVLSSDAFEGRGPATPAETKTVDYVVGQMKAAGLSPGGDPRDGTRAWTQDVPLLRAEIKGTPRLGVTVAGKDEPLTQGDEIAVRAAMDGSTSVAIRHAPVVFLGYGNSLDEPDALTFRRLRRVNDAFFAKVSWLFRS